MFCHHNFFRSSEGSAFPSFPHVLEVNEEDAGDTATHEADTEKAQGRSAENAAGDHAHLQDVQGQPVQRLFANACAVSRIHSTLQCPEAVNKPEMFSFHLLD